MTAVTASRGADQNGDVGALTNGYSAAFLGAAGIAVVGGLLALVTMRRAPVRDTTDEAAVAEPSEPRVAQPV